MFLEKNTPTNPSKWSYYKSQAKLLHTPATYRITCRRPFSNTVRTLAVQALFGKSSDWHLHWYLLQVFWKCWIHNKYRQQTQQQDPISGPSVKPTIIIWSPLTEWSYGAHWFIHPELTEWSYCRMHEEGRAWRIWRKEELEEGRVWRMWSSLAEEFWSILRTWRIHEKENTFSCM